MSTSGTVKLNNHLQKIGRATSLSWEESSVNQVWTCVCKIDGEPRGRGVASHKHVAKDAAAEEALKYLIGDPPEAS
ncbi:hypothetical protein MD484_g7926, partial [Candolleomyces efflorescens]